MKYKFLLALLQDNRDQLQGFSIPPDPDRWFTVKIFNLASFTATNQLKTWH